MQLNAPGTSPDDYFSHAVNAAGTLLAAGSKYGMAHVWDLITGEIVQKPKFGHDKILTVAFDPTGQLPAACRQKGSIAFFHAETGVLAGHIEGYVGQINALAFSPDASGSTETFESPLGASPSA